ncbi:hypothetical protein [Natrialba taiwanensis]|nr:hypothetical protein [Natrialba taiwanensis]
MWPADLYVGMGATESGSESAVIEVLTSGAAVEAYRSLGSLGRVGFQFAATVVLALVVLGLVQGYGTRTVETARRSPVISICIGLPSGLVLAGLASTGYILVGQSVGIFFGIPLVLLGGTTLPILLVLGFVAVGRATMARLGRDRLGSGILAGSVLCGVAGFSIGATILLAVLVASLGIGAFVRVLMSAGGTTAPDERTVPPANKI